jgi:hypothetical protein
MKGEREMKVEKKKAEEEEDSARSRHMEEKV